MSIGKHRPIQSSETPKASSQTIKSTETPQTTQSIEIQPPQTLLRNAQTTQSTYTPQTTQFTETQQTSKIRSYTFNYLDRPKTNQSIETP